MTTSLLLSALVAALSAAFLGGCGLDYYVKSFAGQADMLARARPIDEVVATTTDKRLVERLERTREIRAYASDKLGRRELSSRELTAAVFARIDATDGQLQSYISLARASADVPSGVSARQ